MKLKFIVISNNKQKLFFMSWNPTELEAVVKENKKIYINFWLLIDMQK